VFALLICAGSILTAAASAESPETVWVDVSAQTLQAGGLLPEAVPQLYTPRGDPYADVKTEIYTALISKAEMINLRSYCLATKDVSGVFHSVLNENPELFYVDGDFRYSYDSNVVTSLYPSYDSSYTDEDVDTYRAAVQAVVGMLDPNWSDAEKFLFLHDYLVTHCEYDLTYSRYSAYDALVVGSAVCQGYALAFNDLCTQSGISAAVITSQDLDHAWNLVAVNGEYCYVDCTWDDPSNHWYEGYCAHSNFLLSRNTFAKSHNSTDWTNGTKNVYSSVATSSRYDSAWWQGVITAVARIGNLGAYTLKSDNAHIYLRDFLSSSVRELSLPDVAYWNVWNGNGSYWVGNFSSSAALGGSFYFTMPTAIWSLSTTGEMNRVYSLTKVEQSAGYLYGMVSSGTSLYYNIGTEACDTSFQRAEFSPGPAGGESNGFTYTVLADGTASITACTRSGKIVIPQTIDGYTVTNLASELFYGRSGITSVTIPATVRSFGEDSTNNNLDYVFSYCYDLTRIEVNKNNPTFCSVDGVLFSKDKTTLINYPCNHSGEVYHTEASVFCCTAFASCRNLKFLFIDKANTTWSTYTFYDTADLTAFYIPGGATEKQVKAERKNGRVQDGTSGNPWCALESTGALMYLPASLEQIEAEAFRGTEMPYLIAPAGCKRIEANAFADSALRYLRVGTQTVIENGALSSSVVVDRR